MAEPADVPSTPITIDVRAINGSGCPEDTVRVRENAGNTGFAVRYKAFAAVTGGDAAPTAFRKNCQISLQVNVPEGFTFAIAQADYRGVAKLAKKATALVRTNYYWQGESADNQVDHDFEGPFTGRWHVTDTAASLTWAPCGAEKILNVNSDLRVLDGGTDAPSAIAMTSSSSDVDTLFHVAWKKC